VTDMSGSMAVKLGSLSRREAVTAILRHRDKTLVVSGLGSPSYDVHAAGDRDDNYYLWGAMGGAALVGLGLAQAQPDRHVLVITGDGEQLMAFGSLATIAVARPRNLTIVVIDNHHFGETGMQVSHTGHGIDLANLSLRLPPRICRDPCRRATQSSSRTVSVPISASPQNRLFISALVGETASACSSMGEPRTNNRMTEKGERLK